MDASATEHEVRRASTVTGAIVITEIGAHATDPNVSPIR